MITTNEIKSKTDVAKAVHMIGNAHIDAVWLWRWQEGYAEIKATFRSALDRMNEFPEFIFTCSGAAYYQWVEENAPEMFAEIQARVAEGRWVVVGGWWIQPDCNLPSGESFARHSLYSQRYFRQRFGRIATVGYNVDSFGHHANLPQILKLSGMNAYVFSRPDDREMSLPAQLFWWESEDGSRVMAYRISDGYCTASDVDLSARITAMLELADRQEKDQMCFYGVGNHGGGPTVLNLRDIRSVQANEGVGTIVHSSPDAYFQSISDNGHSLPVVKDELQHHASGCYSTHSETKASNRQAEHRLLTAEKFNAIAYHLLDLPSANGRLQEAWQSVMFNQFHDIMGGCSIKEAYQDARESYGHALYTGGVVLNAALQKISWSIHTMREGITSVTRDKDRILWEQGNLGAPFVVFNSLSWEVEAPVEVPQQVNGITDELGVPMRLQSVRASRTNFGDKYDTLFTARIPAMGYRVYWIYREKTFELSDSANASDASEMTVTSDSLENRFIRLTIEAHTGYVSSLLDKRSGMEVLDNQGAIPIVVDEHNSDTWAHRVFEFRDEIGKFTDAEVQVIESGPVRGRLRVTSRYGQSTLRQDFMLHRDSPIVRVKVKLDWREKHKMLKLSFPLRIDAPQATYEIPYGYIERPVNGEEEPGQQWIDITGTVPEDGRPYGLALLNDSKYSFDVKDNDLRMTLVRSPIFADHFGQRDELCEYMEQGVHEFAYSLVPHEGSWRDAGVVRKAYEFNVPPAYVIETYHEGSLPQSYSGIVISSEHIVVTAFKLAEELDGYILRCFETMGEAAEVTIEIPMLGKKWSANFNKCEIKTFKISLDSEQEVIETNLLES
jgi:alpha-mannosidase